MLHVMTVCTGNICRSPMAQVVLERHLADADLAATVTVSSRGISDEEHGNPIDRRAQAVLRGAGYDVPAHAAAQVKRQELGQQDLVLAMTWGHYRSLTRLAPGSAVGKIAMYRSFDPRLTGREPGPDLDIDDPWYGGETDFEEVLEQIEAAAPSIVTELASLR